MNNNQKRTRADELFSRVPNEISKIEEKKINEENKKTLERDKYINWRKGILERSTRNILEIVPKKIAESRKYYGNKKWIFIVNLIYSDCCSDDADFMGYHWRCKQRAKSAVYRDMANENYNWQRPYKYYEMEYLNFIKFTREERDFIKNEFEAAGFVVKKTVSWRLMILDTYVS